MTDAPHDLPLPRWAYVPGRNGEPDRATLERVKTLVPTRFGDAVPADHPALLYGLALNDRNFFWECHEILEAVWKAAPQGGRDRILLRALIQIANANLKQVTAQPRAVERLVKEAVAELDELSVRVSQCDGIVASYPAMRLATVLRARLNDPNRTAPVMLLTHDDV